MIKKLIAACVMLCMLLTESAYAGKAPLDAVETEFSEAATVLSRLGIMEVYEDNSFRPYEAITRGQFVFAIFKLINLEIPSFSETDFIDVPETHMYYQAIAAVHHMGYISGTSATTFSPDELITVIQAIKIIVSVLGYELWAENTGGYPTGYLSCAQNIGLLKKLSITAGNVLIRGEAANILYAALDTVKLEQTAFGENEATYTTAGNKTLLSDNLKLIKYEGILSANSATGILPMKKLRKGCVAIGDMILNENESNAGELIGRRVVAYVNEDDNILVCLLQSMKNDEILIKARDLDTSNTQIGVITYYSRKGITKARFEKSAVVIKNGEVINDYTDDIFKIKTGSITLVSSRLSGEFDTVYIKEPIYGIVEKFYSDQYKLVLKYGGKNVELQRDSVMNVTINGVKGVLDDLREWMSVEIISTSAGDWVAVKASGEIVAGIVTELFDDGMRIDGESYAVSELFNALNEKNHIRVSAGNKYQFIINVNGEIDAVTDMNYNIRKYGFLYKIHSGTGIDNQVKIKMFTENDQFEVYSVAKHIILNGSRILATELLNPANGLTGEAGTVKRQLVTYQLNGDKELDTLNTAIDNITRKDYSTGEFTLDSNMVGKSANLYYSNIGINFRTNADSKLFIVPAVVDNETVSVLDDEAGYRVDIVSRLGSDYTLSNYIIYSTDRARNVGAMVLFRETAGSNPDILTTEAVVVDRITKAVDDMGEEIYKLYYYDRGDYKTATVRDNQIKSSFIESDPWQHDGYPITSLSCGDVIQLVTKANGDIQGFHALFLVNDPPLEFKEIVRSSVVVSADDVGKTNLYTAYGRVNDRYNDTMSVITNISDRNFDRCVKFSSRCAVYVYENAKLRNGVYDDIRIDDVVFFRMNNYVTSTVLVIR